MYIHMQCIYLPAGLSVPTFGSIPPQLGTVMQMGTTCCESILSRQALTGFLRLPGVVEFGLLFRGSDFRTKLRISGTPDLRTKCGG